MFDKYRVNAHETIEDIAVVIIFTLYISLSVNPYD